LPIGIMRSLGFVLFYTAVWWVFDFFFK
jgi:hypothetical protein